MLWICNVDEIPWYDAKLGKVAFSPSKRCSDCRRNWSWPRNYWSSTHLLKRWRQEPHRVHLWVPPWQADSCHQTDCSNWRQNDWSKDQREGGGQTAIRRRHCLRKCSDIRRKRHHKERRSNHFGAGQSASKSMCSNQYLDDQAAPYRRRRLRVCAADFLYASVQAAWNSFKLLRTRRMVS